MGEILFDIQFCKVSGGKFFGKERRGTIGVAPERSVALGGICYPSISRFRLQYNKYINVFFLPHFLISKLLRSGYVSIIYFL